MLATTSCPSSRPPFCSVLSALSTAVSEPCAALPTSRARSGLYVEIICSRLVSAEAAPASCAPSLRPSSTHERGCSAHTALLQQQAAAPRQDMEMDTDARTVLWLES